MEKYGYIKISRKLLDWEWADDSLTLALWIHILLDANWEDKKWHGEVLSRGSLITSLSKLSASSGISIGGVRASLSKLVNCGSITIESTNRWTKISVCNYDSYQFSGDCPEQVNGPEKVVAAPTKPIVEAKGIMSGKEIKERVDRLYALYPTKCPISGRPTGKGSKDKRKLESLLKAGHSEEELSSTIKRYIQESKKGDSYIKNFQTFLNNLPDYGSSDIWSQEPEQNQQEPVVYYKSIEELEAARRAKKNK